MSRAVATKCVKGTFLKKLSVGFDFDLTLADSRTGIRNCLEVLCAEFPDSCVASDLDYFARSGNTLEGILKQMFEIDDLETLRNRFMELYPSLGVTGTILMPGADKLLEYCRNNVHRLVLISAKSPKNLEISLEHLGLEFDQVFGGVSGLDKTQKILESGIDIYIGDQIGDVAAAESAGVQAILVGGLPLQDNKRYNYLHFQDLEGVLDWLSVELSGQ